MPQRTLHSYFHFPARPPPLIISPSLLDLPFSIRRHIYVLSGLVRICPIDLNQEGARKVNADQKPSVFGNTQGECYYLNKRLFDHSFEWHEDDIDCVCPPLPTQLLYVSRAISKECSHVLYSENKFKICRSRYRGFLPLHYMAGTALNSITSLSIRLNACSCRPSHQHTNQRQCDYHRTCKGGICGQDKPLGRISRNDKSTILDWKSVCARISSNIRPFYLGLSVICDTANYETAVEIIEPLSKMPTLRTCSIRLGQTPNHELRRLAQTTVYQATGRFAKTPTHQYCNTYLPLEIQQRILGYTDLIAPHVLYWEPNHRLMVGDCCRNCTDALEACCCSLQHASFSEKCTCWKIPTDLFLISYRLREEAFKIFYERNSFAILPPGANFTLIDIQPPLLAFLAALPQQALRHLRSIEFVFPVLSPNFLIPGTESYLLWLQTTTFISTNLQLSTLNLTLNLSGNRGSSSDNAYISVQEILDKDDAMWETYQRIIEPLTIAPLYRGLKNLFIHLSWPLDDQKLHIWDAQEGILEKRIMGEDYDAALHGKFVSGSAGMLGLKNSLY